EMHPDLGCYVPEVISTKYLKGENLDKNPEDITGGTNGLGMKLTNTYSKQFILETYDDVCRKLYVQVSKNNMAIVEEPKISGKLTIPKEKQSSHTTITFTPDYAALGYTTAFVNTDYEKD